MDMFEYSDETLQEINNNANLLEYVEQTYDLKKSGSNYFTNCPKHIDKTPSLCFNEEENAYYCFSCGRSGRFIGYLMDYEGMCFKEAVVKASKYANIDLNKLCRSPVVACLRKVHKNNHNKEKKYDHPTISKKDYYALYDKEPIKEWLDEGIKQSVMDLFEVRADHSKNRIVYPVYDENNNLINIKGRTRNKLYKELKIPKYINYYPVGKMDYFQGLNITLPYIKKKNEIIIFESIKSVMLAFGWGYKNCVSAEKHTLTDAQTSLLAKMHINVVLAFDSDIDYFRIDSIKKTISKLKRITNIYVIEDTDNLLGGLEGKNSPVDLGKDVWEILYSKKRKVV